MPRKPQTPHPLRTLRAFAGMSQEQFAATLGVAGISIKRIENGSLPLSDALGETIALRTGAHPDSLKDPYGLLRHLDGEPYTAEHYRQHTTKTDTRFKLELIDRETMKKARFHFTAAQRVAADRNKLVLFQHRFQNWLDETLAEMGLSPAFQKHLADSGVPDLARRSLFGKFTGGKPYRIGLTTVTLPYVKKPLSPAMERVKAAFKKERDAATPPASPQPSRPSPAPASKRRRRP